MTVTTVLPTSVRRPVRDWLRAASLDVVGERVYAGIPANATYPLIDVTLVDAGMQPGDTPQLVPRIQLDVWGNGPTANAAELEGIAFQLLSLLKTTNYAEAAGVALQGIEVSSGPLPRYDPDGTPRYLIEAAIAMKVLA